MRVSLSSSGHFVARPQKRSGPVTGKIGQRSRISTKQKIGTNKWRHALRHVGRKKAEPARCGLSVAKLLAPEESQRSMGSVAQSQRVNSASEVSSVRERKNLSNKSRWGKVLHPVSGFPNIRVKKITSAGVESWRHLSELCLGKVCVLDFWLRKGVPSPLVSFDA